MRNQLLFGVFTMAWMSSAWGGEIGFVEDFALAKDRASVLKQLVPGTQDYSYYHALHAIQTEQFNVVDQLLADWVRRHGETDRVWEIRTRLALALYEKSPQKSLDFLRNRLGLNYLHQKEEVNAEPKLPTSLDPAAISREAFIERANAVTTDNTDLFEETALDWLVGYELNPNHRRSVLSRLSRPDYPKLVKHVIEDLNQDNSGGFGSLAIHRQLLVNQLEEVIKAKPELLNNQNLVHAYLTKLQPSADEDWQHDLEQRAAYLARLTKFANRLAPVHNTLKAHVLYHRLVLDRQRGELDKGRFIEYLRLPRPVAYLSKRMSESDTLKSFPSDLNGNYNGATLFPPIGNDEPLVRSYLSHFLLDAANSKEFEPYINDTYLQYLFAEVKIVNGLGNVEQWAALLPPAQFQQLKERVDIDFTSTNKTQFAPNEPVTLDLTIKNINTLIVKVFEINTQSYYRSHLKEVDTDINLDGLVANEEQTHSSSESPLRRVSKRFEFPKLDKPGVYVIDFIGNGRSSRALIRKGRLRHLVRTVAEGQAFTIFNEKNEQLKEATLWLSGHEYRPDQNGLILVPFTASPVRQAMIISHKGYSSLDYFQHEPETHALTAGFYVDRESLLKKRTAQLIVRPSLSMNGTPISITLLDEVSLTINSTDLDGVQSSKVVPNFKLFEDRESTHEFPVPPRLASLVFTLRAKVKKQSEGGRELELSASDSLSLNGVDKTDKIEQLHLAKFADNYVLELLGKSGEPKVSRPVLVTVKHRDFRQAFPVSLKTDSKGQIVLGPLHEVSVVSGSVSESNSQTWHLLQDAHTYAQSLHGQREGTIVLPYLPRRVGAQLKSDQVLDQKTTRDELSLLEVRSDVFTVDRFENMTVKDGLIHISNLPPGDFDLLLKSTGTRIRIRVTEGPQLDGFAMGRRRQLELPRLAPVQIVSFAPTESGLQISLKNSSEFTRVHVFATRYLPEYNVFSRLSRVRGAEPYLVQQISAESIFLTGRNIGDEYRYIIDRKYTTRYPGNMLERPSLLLNPWAVRETATGEQQAAGGEEFGSVGAPPQSVSIKEESRQSDSAPQAGNLTNLDFLESGSAAFLNLIPDKEGQIQIDKDLLGPHQQFHVVAVDPLNTTYRSISLPEEKRRFLDLRLSRGLDANGHFTQQKQVTSIPAGQKFTLADVTTSKFEAYDSLERVFGLYRTLNADPNLKEFSFLLTWPNLNQSERRALYSKYASHELSFFLFKKDPEFFRDVVKPYLANKKDRTFLDRYLLEEDLSEFVEPWKFEQLNVVERILLGQRIDGEKEIVTRHLGELYALLPPNTENTLRLFETAIMRSSLELGDAFGWRDASDRLTDKRFLLFDNSGGAMNGPFGGGASDTPGMGGMPGSALGVPMKEMSEKQLEAKKSYGRRSGGSRAPGDWKLDKLQRAKDSDSDGTAADADEQRDQLFFARLSEVEAFGVRRLYRKLDQTKEWAENNYHHLPIDQQHAGLVTVNSFWNDYAQHSRETPFLSRNLAEASRNFTEILFALAVLDLPFESSTHETKYDGAEMSLTAKSPIIVFHEEIRPSRKSDDPTKVLVSQNFFRLGDRTRIEGGEQVDKFVTEEFLTQVVYGCQVVLTNPTSARQKLNLLVQIPTGSIPVLNGQETKALSLNLEPYHTQTLDYYFYFPAVGQYPHFPVHVAKNEVFIASTAPITFNVVDKPTKVDTGSWDYVSQYGSLDEVLAFLDQHNINALNLDRIAWRMHDRNAFTSTLVKLTQRHLYQHTLWSYALLHNIPERAHEFLQHADQIVKDCGGTIKSPLLTIDPIERRMLEHLEYKPLANARAHSLGKRRQIVNDRVRFQYHRTLKDLSYARKLDSDDLLIVTYYLLLQDRVDEALGFFRQVDATKVSTRIQYDYCAAYLDFFQEEHSLARGIALKYLDYPVDRWRQAFEVIIAQLDEAEGKSGKVVDEKDRNQQQDLLALSEPGFEFVVEAKEIKLDARNLEFVRVNFYEMDVELLFSRNPFVQQFSGQFSSIKPNLSLEIDLTGDASVAANSPPGEIVKRIPLPAAVQNKNVLIEIVGAGVAKTQAYYSNSLAVQVIENYGQIKVSHSSDGKPISKAYIKVYAQTTRGGVQFHKDGYTDLRGRFDYASLSSSVQDTATQFSILVLSDENGAVVKEALPPKQ